MLESAFGILSNPLNLLAYLLIVAVGVLGVLRQRTRGAVSAREEIAEEDPQWNQAQATVLQALGARGFQRDEDVAEGSRLLMERADLVISVSWDARQRRVSARVSEPIHRSAVSERGTDAVARQNLFSCQLPRRGKADGVIAQFAEQLQARTASLGV
jgi:hypothetical protein